MFICLKKGETISSLLKERAGNAREKSNINNNIRKVQLGNRGGGSTHFGASLRTMQQAF